VQVCAKCAGIFELSCLVAVDLYVVAVDLCIYTLESRHNLDKSRPTGKRVMSHM